MTVEELFEKLKKRYVSIIEENHLQGSKVEVNCRGLTPEEAIGNVDRNDYPILNGAEVMLQAEFEGGIGQAFTSNPVDYKGCLEDILNRDIVHNDYDRAIFIAVFNALSDKCGLCDRSVHCKNAGPKECSELAMDFLVEKYPKDTKICQIGYQPALLRGLSENFTNVRILDLNPDNVGHTRFGIKVLDGIKDYEDSVLKWADIVLCTSSTIANGSMVNFLDIGKRVWFYGTTGAGAAAVLGLDRLCFADQVSRKEVKPAENSESLPVNKNGGAGDLEKVVKIEGMMCPHCEAKVKKALEALDGVSSAIASHEKGTAEVTMTADVADQVLMDAVTGAGFTPKGVE